MANKKAISKKKNSKVAAKTTKKSKKKISTKAKVSTKPKVSAKRKVSAEVEIPKELEIAEVATRKVDQRNDAMIPVQARHNDEFQDDQSTSRKRRRTSGRTFAGEIQQEQRRAVSAEVSTQIDARERIRAPHRSQNQNRSK